MLDFARERLAGAGLKATLWEDWMQGFTVPRKQHFDLAHCFVTTFKYLLTERDALACLQRVAASLKPNGLFVLGLHLTDYDHTRVQLERWTGQRDGVSVTCNIRSWPADRKKRTEAVRSRLTVQRGRERHVQDTNWEFRTYNAAQLRRLLGKVPEFELAACYDFHYDPESPRELDDSYADIVLILRRTQTDASATVH